MAIDRTGISSLDAGASDITYSGDEGPKSPDQQLMASADPMLVEEYNKYVFEMEEQGLQPISFKEFVQQIMSEANMAQGGIARIGLFGGGPPGVHGRETGGGYSDKERHERRQNVGGPPGITTAPTHIPKPSVPSVIGGGGGDGFERTDGGRYLTDTRELIAAKKKRDYFASLLGETDEDDVTDTDYTQVADISFPKGKFSWDQPGTYTYGGEFPTIPQSIKENIDKQFKRKGITTQKQKKEFFNTFSDIINERARRSGGISAATITTPEIMANTDIIPDTRNWFQKIYDKVFLIK